MAGEMPLNYRRTKDNGVITYDGDSHLFVDIYSEKEYSDRHNQARFLIFRKSEK